MSHRLNRRRFLKTTGWTSAGALAWGMKTPWVLAQDRSPSANEKLDIAVVGVGGRGAGDLAGVSSENIVALCDIDDLRLGKAAEKHPAAKRYNDFRRMLDEMDKQIDAVVVATPDHVHATASVSAMRRGKHCYCEKPLTHNVSEARVAAQVAKENHLATQMGTQIHAGGNYRRVVELIQSGAIGPVHEVHVWCGKSWGGGRRPTETPPVPKNIHWDLWIGPAPFRPYHPVYIPANWRRWWDFGSGTLGDMACHYMDLPFWALGLRHPTSIEAEGPPVDPETCPVKLIVRYEFPARGDQPGLKLSWYDGENRPPILAERGLPTWGSGVLFVGGEGMLLADYGRRELYPKEKFAGFQAPEPTIPDSIGHHKEWIEACKTGGPTTCNFDYSGALTEAVLLGAVAYRVGKRIEWDGENLKARGCAEADQYLRRAYRQGWTL